MIPESMEDATIAVCHGNYVGRGGGEHVAETIARIFDAPIYYGFGEPENEPSDIETHSLFNDVFGAGLVRRIYQLRDLYYMYGWRSVPELYDYDIIIQSGNEPSWYKPPEDQIVVKYTHSPPRNAYDRYPYRAPNNGIVYDMYTFATEQLYQSVLSYPDTYIANSEIVQRRMDKYWGLPQRDVKVVYPPVETTTFGPEHEANSPIEGPFYLVLDRLEGTKHIDEVISAFRDNQDKELVIAGRGSDEESLRKQAQDLENVTFCGYVTEEEKRGLLAASEALVYAAEDEDFGIVPVEALASGIPVIGPREGFTQHQITHLETGMLYDRGNLSDVIQSFDVEKMARPETIQRIAEQYDVSRFKEKLRDTITRAMDRSRITVDSPSLTQEKKPVVADGGNSDE